MSRPNILLVVADDMGYGDFGVFNDGTASTPRLDALVDESICLAQHYAGAPACSPSRWAAQQPKRRSRSMASGKSKSR